MEELSREERENPPMVEAVATHMPASSIIRIFGVGAVLGFCRTALAGTSFSMDDKNTYEKYLKRNQRTLLTEPEKYKHAIAYMQKEEIGRAHV